MLYGVQIWGVDLKGKPLAKNSLAPLVKLQNQCLRRITGAYKRTPRAALEREAAVPPPDVYTDTIAMQRAATVQGHPVEKDIRQTLERIRGARAPRRGTAPKLTSQEALRLRAAEREQEIRELLQHQAETRRHAGGAPPQQQRIGGHQHKWRSTTCIARWADIEWNRRWKKAAKTQRAATWSTPWTTPTLPLYEGQTKAESTAAFLLRTEVIGLNAWLASIHVPNTTPHCACGGLHSQCAIYFSSATTVRQETSFSLGHAQMILPE
jgi:hypothetical protein